MRRIDSGYDDLLRSNYELYAVKFSELKTLARLWYKNLNIKRYDTRSYDNHRKDDNLMEMKLSGIVCNYFFAYREGSKTRFDNDPKAQEVLDRMEAKYYLMDGFNRLFTDYGETGTDNVVYLKVLTDKLEEHHLMEIMFRLNMWKLKGTRNWSYLSTFFDRGISLFLYAKFRIRLYSYRTVDHYRLIGFGTSDKKSKITYEMIERTVSDIDMIGEYFKYITDTYEGSYGYEHIARLFSNERVVDDFREIVQQNKYSDKHPPFKNYRDFFKVFINMMAFRRLMGDIQECKLETYLKRLEVDTKFFKKLKGMSGNIWTKRAVRQFFLEQPEIIKLKNEVEK